MVAYSFQKRFVPPILGGVKDQTIRGERRRHARPGEELQLFTGMRTRHCKLVARRPCVAVRSMVMMLGSGLIVVDNRRVDDLDAFARRDGFRDFDDMSTFWDADVRCRMWSAWLIRWEPIAPDFPLADMERST